MKFYLASRYSLRAEMLHRAAQLQALGHTSTASWILGHHEAEAKPHDHDYALAERASFAKQDIDDLEAADVCISFTEDPLGDVPGRSRGGRHVEFGMAYAWGLRMIIIGHRENVFHCLPNIHFFPSWEEFLSSELLIELAE